MKVLVTGCAGFVGSKVGEILIHSGAHVVGVDNLNRGYDPRLKECRRSQLRGKPNFTFYHCDILDRQVLEDLFQGHTLDGVLNLAARAGVG